MTGTGHSSKGFGGHQPMSVPRTDRGVPSPVRGVPSLSKSISGQSPSGKIFCVFQPQGTQGTRKAPARRLHMFRAGAGSLEGSRTLKTLHKRAPRGRIEAQYRPVLPVLRIAHRNDGGGPAHLYTIALNTYSGELPSWFNRRAKEIITDEFFVQMKNYQEFYKVVD